MSNFVVAVGGSGAKLMQTLINLGAAGLMPSQQRELSAILVDPDENNGNIEQCQALAKSYEQCRKLLNMGTTDLFSSPITMVGPWTPIRDGHVDTLKEIFQYDRLALANSLDAELLELLFETGELEMSIKQGFRGRPAIGATVLAEAVHFTESPWKEFKEKVKNRVAQGSVHILLAGSVFGGSGASGVPTLVRLIEREFADKLENLRMGLVLFLPFFQFRPVPGEEIQADPAAFPMATAEALKYYHERGFLSFCHSIYCVGEQIPAQVAISAVGASEQRNDPHFVELIAGMGSMRFFDDKLESKPASLAVAGRKAEQTVTWQDLPYDEHQGNSFIRKLQQMTVFAAVYRYVFFPLIAKGLTRGKSDAAFWVDHVERPKVNLDEAGLALRQLNDYVEQFLLWMMHVSTPRRDNFAPGMINPTVFAEYDGEKWQLKPVGKDYDFSPLLHSPDKVKIDVRAIYQKTTREVDDEHAVGAGRLVRALYDACAIE